ncbi:MAG: ParA family partition ATPase [Gammaproteobacteria bacterium]|nr:ParA family partition ATPase [Gammaproteobacteria bacterium]
MAVIALVGNKGGAGKTTLAVNLAAALARRGATAVLDVDPQGSALQWRAFIDHDRAPPVFGPEGDELEGQVAVLRRRFEHLVVDCPPSVHAPATDAALRVVELALIPVQPSPVDLWATVHVERAVAEARETNPGLEAMLVINQLEPRTTLSRLMREALAELELPVATTAIRRRAIYRNTALEGRTVYDAGRRGAAAAAEVDELINEVIRP